MGHGHGHGMPTSASGRHVGRLAAAFIVTAVFMVLFSIQLTIYAFHEFTEAGAIPFIDNAYWHLATEDLAEGMIGQWLSYSLLIAPVAFLAYAWLTRRGAPREATPQKT